MKTIRAHVVISGRVQGVFFREKTRQEALELGLAGWVRNNPDGTVEAVFEGPENRVREILLWCREGPPLARVENLEIRYEDPQGEKGFRVLV